MESSEQDGDNYGFEPVELDSTYKRLKGEDRAPYEPSCYSISLMHMPLEFEGAHSRNERDSSGHTIKVIEDEVISKDTYYYVFKISLWSKPEGLTIKKRFQHFKEFRQELKAAFFIGEGRVSIRGSTDQGDEKFEGYHIIPVLDESFTPANMEQAKERMAQLRLFLLKILCNQALAESPITKAFLEKEESTQGMAAKVKDKLGRIFSKAEKATQDYIKTFIAGGNSVEPELAKARDNAKKLQEDLQSYIEMLSLAGAPITDEQRKDGKACIAFAHDCELQIEAIVDAERTMKEKEQQLAFLRKRMMVSHKDMNREVDEALCNNTGIWLSNSKIFLKFEKETILEALERDFKLLEDLVIRLMINITTVKASDISAGNTPQEQAAPAQMEADYK